MNNGRNICDLTSNPHKWFHWPTQMDRKKYKKYNRQSERVRGRGEKRTPNNIIAVLTDPGSSFRPMIIFFLDNINGGRDRESEQWIALRHNLVRHKANTQTRKWFENQHTNTHTYVIFCEHSNYDCPRVHTYHHCNASQPTANPNTHMRQIGTLHIDEYIAMFSFHSTIQSCSSTFCHIDIVPLAAPPDTRSLIQCHAKLCTRRHWMNGRVQAKSSAGRSTIVVVRSSRSSYMSQTTNQFKPNQPAPHAIPAK